MEYPYFVSRVRGTYEPLELEPVGISSRDIVRHALDPPYHDIISNSRQTCRFWCELVRWTRFLASSHLVPDETLLCYTNAMTGLISCGLVRASLTLRAS